MCDSVEVVTEVPPSVETASPGRNLVWFGLDIGGTLCKSVYFETIMPRDKTESKGDEIDITNLRNYLMSSETYGSSGTRDSKLMLRDVTIGKLRGNLHFMKFESQRMMEFWISLY